MSTKKQNLLDFLDLGTTTIVMHSLTSDVVLPPHLMNSHKVLLNLSYSFDTRHFEITDDYIKVDLSFSQKRFDCVLPLKNIYYIFPQSNFLEGKGYEDSFPMNILKTLINFENSANSEFSVEDDEEE